MCELCNKNKSIKIIYKQLHGETKRIKVCENCLNEHEKHLEMVRKNFLIQTNY